MIFSKRYKQLLRDNSGNYVSDFIGNWDFCTGKRLVSILKSFNEPLILKISRYTKETVTTDAFTYALTLLNKNCECSIFDTYWRSRIEEQLVYNCNANLFDTIEIQYEILSAKGKRDFQKELNSFFSDNNLPWLLSNGKIVKIDAKQFELDIKRKTLEQMKELSDSDSKFSSAFNELQKAVEFYKKEDYSEAITNACKCYESVMKVILNVNKGRPNDMLEKIKEKLDLPQTINPSGMKDNVLMSLPYIRNNATSHGAGINQVIISKELANLGINLASSLCTYLIESNLLFLLESE